MISRVVRSRLLGALIGVMLISWSSLSMAKSLPINTRLGGDFELPSTLKTEAGNPGKLAKLSDFKGKVVLLNFGYTHCPDICPMVLARMTQIVKRLGDDAKEVQGVFITFDPNRDTAERLSEYIPYFNKTFVGFTGTEAQIAQAAKQYGVIYLPQRGESEAGLLFSHSDFIYLLDRQGRVRALFATDEPLDKMANDVRSLIAEE
ncbi:MAG: SCO family protein [Pseudomonadales bacterium]|nr:SCO family protein [Pseudomonadales bacterium]